MKKRKFLVSSLPLAATALVAQAIVFYLILLAVAQLQMLILLPLGLGAHAASQVAAGYGNVPLFVLLTGLALAILSLACVVTSFRRREPGWGWRLLPFTLLTIYLGSWFPLLLG